MGKTIRVSLNAASIDRAITELNDYKAGLKSKGKLLCERLAAMGATKVSLGYARAAYTGDKDISVSVEESDKGYRIIAAGESVAFVEFGAGVKMGGGHPLNGQFGTGPGTYPNGKGHWDDPNGWYLPKDKGGAHTYGNPPAMVMYDAGKELREEILRVAKEVFSS